MHNYADKVRGTDYIVVVEILLCLTAASFCRVFAHYTHSEVANLLVGQLISCCFLHLALVLWPEKYGKINRHDTSRMLCRKNSFLKTIELFFSFPLTFHSFIFSWINAELGQKGKSTWQISQLSNFCYIICGSQSANFFLCFLCIIARGLHNACMHLK